MLNRYNILLYIFNNHLRRWITVLQEPSEEDAAATRIQTQTRKGKYSPTVTDSFPGCRIVSPADVELNMEDNGISASDRRKQNAERRSQLAETHPINGAGGESDEEEIDVKKMKVNFDETKQIMAIVHEIEQDYTSSKVQVNKFDSMALEADCAIKTLKQSYRVLKENLYKDNPNFDQQKIEGTIHQLKQAIESDAAALSALKGEYFATNDAVVNKDSNVFKIDQVKRTRAKQLRVLEKFERVEQDIQLQSDKILNFEHLYHDFEKKLF